MQIRSIYRGARISAFKAREVTREIQGLPVVRALDILAFTPKKAAILVAKTLKSAVANAENNANLRVEKLVVREAVVGEGPTLKRFQPKARGSAGPIRKRTSHIRIVLTDEITIKTRAPKKSGGKKKTRQSAVRKTSKEKASAPKAPAKPANTGDESTNQE
jgi:large subunit ribosomal protein L22